MWWRILLISLAYLLIGAHFLRFGQNEACIAFALCPLLLFIKTTWATRLLQLGLIVSAVLVWGVSSFEYVQMRIIAEAPWYRLSAIMAGVIAFTLFAAWCCNGIIQKRNQRKIFS
ncbi:MULTISPECIES: hypothetical protein [unclassified Shewanella]|uniref:hypothetical protein n=1 Tax=unclassified Shewanella TaxID=196818 RepID=UPI001BBA30CE|nr:MULTISPECIES: hypothetical protein [unclassified Shewanella]GIU08105.1 hypothetical protein TUM4444_08640 [Shewanella sp. MBTL60-112-B1]GIU40684.1 hypothetical protein TUM4445_40350 [Shewanella sp. MBTL60-112-B2]